MYSVYLDQLQLAGRPDVLWRRLELADPDENVVKLINDKRKNKA